MTTTPVVSVTDELLAEIEALAENATPGPWVAYQEMVVTQKEGADGWEIADVRPDVPECEANKRLMASANPATMLALTTELRRLRAEVQALQSNLNTSRNDHAQAMVWLTKMRFAAGDSDARLMLSDLVGVIEALMVDAGRYRWLLENSDMMHWENMLHFSDLEGFESVGEFIDTAMQSNTEGN